MISRRQALYFLQRNCPPPSGISVQRGLFRAFQDRQQVLDQAMRIMHAAVHSHSSRRAVQVRGISGKQYPAVSEGLQAALLQFVVIAQQNQVGLLTGKGILYV